VGRGRSRQPGKQGGHLVAGEGAPHAHVAQRLVGPARLPADEPGHLVDVKLVARVERHQRAGHGQTGHQRVHRLARRRVEQPDFSGWG